MRHRPMGRVGQWQRAAFGRGVVGVDFYIGRTGFADLASLSAGRRERRPMNLLTCFQPVWLLLLIPLAAAWFIWPLPNRGLLILRAVIFVTIVFALAQLALRLPDRAGTVIVVADRSESMPDKAAASEKEIIGLLHKSMGARDQLGVVAFGREAIVEQSPQRGEFSGFNARVGADHSSLNDAIESALALIPADGGERILVLSD